MRSLDSYVYRGGNAYELTKEHARELGGSPLLHRARNLSELDRALASGPESLAIGHWEEELSAIVDEMVRRRPPLRHLFLGDITHRESEISWIKQPKIERIFDALPRLETLRIRGSDGLSLGCVSHERLRALIIESGGLHGGIARDLSGCMFPALEHLELWLGRAEYGAAIRAEDLEPVLDPARLPRLDHLGLRNSEITDEIAPAALQSALATQLSSLDLSLGIINDQVAKAILGIPSARAIATIDVGHHSIRADLVDRLRSMGNVVGLDHPAENDEERYTAIGE